jgi:uncharacterized protein (DUF2336 family)
LDAQRSLIDEVERVMATGSADQRVNILRRVTDLFMVGPDKYSELQVEIFGDVIGRLAEQIELKARAELANRLAPVNNAPVSVVRALAKDESIEVAGPVLSQSPRLTEQDLIEAAESRGQDRLLAISKRKSISEAISDLLVAHGDYEVLRSVARNEGARFSRVSYGRLVEKSIDDEELAVSVGLRKDISKEHFHALVARASEAVFKKLAAANPENAEEVNRVLFELTGRKVQPEIKRDYTQAKKEFERQQRAGRPFEQLVQQFAINGKFEETIYAIAAACSVPVEMVERTLCDKSADIDALLLLLKAADLDWPTAKLILGMRRGSIGVSTQSAADAGRNYARLQAATAKRVVRFYQVRQAAGETA